MILIEVSQVCTTLAVNSPAWSKTEPSSKHILEHTLFASPKLHLLTLFRLLKFFLKSCRKLFKTPNFPKVIHVQRISREFKDFQVCGHPVRIRVSENACCSIHLRTMEPLNYRHTGIP